MAWLEFHQELPRHPKTDVLMDELGISRPTAVGMLGMSWIWAMEFAIDGFIPEKRVGAAARGSGWDAAPAVFAAAMVAAGWWDPTDGGYLVHNWQKYIGKLIEKRQKDNERKKSASGTKAEGSKKPAKASTGNPEEFQRNSDGSSSESAGKPTNQPTYQPSSPARAHEGSAAPVPEEEDGRLSIALKGKVLDPAEFALSVARSIASSHGDRAFDAWVDMPNSKRTDWLLIAWEKAIAANAKVRTKYVAGVIGSALLEGIDLANPGDQGSCAAPAAPPPVDPQIVRDRYSRQLAPLLLRSGMERREAEAFMRDSPLEVLEARLVELRANPPNGDSRGAA